MDTYFARHTQSLDIDLATRARLWADDLIAVHYPERLDGDLTQADNASLDINDYPRSGSKARSVIGAINALAKDGGYVCAEYYPGDQIKIGWVSPGSAVKIVEGRWGSQNKPATLKTLKLEKSRVLPPLQTAVVLAGRPRQGTLQRWFACKHRILNLVEGIKADVGLDDLLHYEQEMMCAEFLRLPRAREVGLPQLAALLVPVGGTMKDADIFGMSTDGNIIVCQVTWYEESASASKKNALKKYAKAEKSVAIFFCNCKEPSQDGEITVFPLDAVFDEFTTTKVGAQWLSAIRPY